MNTNLLAVFLQVEYEDKKATMRTPINNKGCRSVIDPNDDFHAGHYLCDVLQEEGCDMVYAEVLNWNDEMSREYN